jgi:hypothetical protein
MVGQQPLELPIGVRVPASQPFFRGPFLPSAIPQFPSAIA